MTNQNDIKIPGGAREKKDATGRWIVPAVVTVAFLSRLPALGAYWNQDDWGLLARASGLIGAPDITIRWLSQAAYWQLLWPLAGLATAPYAVTRLLLHAAAAGGVARLARRLQLTPAQQLLAGLIMAATPLAFSPLYWAAGVQDLLAVCCLVWSLERWLSPSATGRPVAILLAVAAVASKETVIGLPLLLGWLLVFGPAPRPAGAARARRFPLAGWALILPAALAAAAAGWQALRFFATGPAEPYTLGGPAIVLGNLSLYGAWLVMPGPHYPAISGLPHFLAGLLTWLAWAGWSLHQWRRGRRTPAFCLLGALLMLAPLLGLTRHLAPDLAYPVEPFGCLAIACLLPGRLRPHRMFMAALILLAWAWGFFGMQARMSLRGADGRHADPVARRTAVSAAAVRQLERLPRTGGGLVIVQPPLTSQTASMADNLGENWVTGSTLYHSLEGPLGPRLLLAAKHGDAVPVSWTNGLRQTPENAFVVLDHQDRLVPWGMTRQALLYQTLTDLGLGFFERAHLHLLRASLLSGDYLSIAFDPDRLPIPLHRAAAHLEAFLDHLDGHIVSGRSAEEIQALQANILRLMSVCTGRDTATLAPGRIQPADPLTEERP